ncbi:glycosyltransferase family 4 protein [Acuticoccus sp. M5D2P5]|uniref:glycosyltransferase family 4 protein n=1 Tax=Acuticoccus kalidii TaxID=2910977 RepID=UPI001F3F3763|nr:glycosyltransferase family 4 protein [Acuticoccus kalidii]MCF3936662.1 glycosyltransferase family 4 protein [Acuticoccus kalidii]
MAGFPGSVTAFDPDRLERAATEYVIRRDPNADFDEFHGATPWTRCYPPGPYGVFIDATFAQYLDVYTDRSCFDAGDIARIEAEEGAFLRDADMVFFASDWARGDALARYGLAADRCRVVYAGGNIVRPEADTFSGGNRFLFVSLDFEAKGGRLAAGALQRLRHRVPDAELQVIGDRPPDDIMRLPGVVYIGRLRKSVPEECQRLSAHFASARALVHPTARDTVGLVLIEAAYHGCPAVTTRRFGVPEFVRDGETGYLLDPPIGEEAITAALAALCDDGADYRAMRARTFANAHRNLTFDAFGNRMIDAIDAVLLRERGCRLEPRS